MKFWQSLKECLIKLDWIILIERNIVWVFLLLGYFYYPFKDTGPNISLIEILTPLHSWGRGMSRSISSFSRFEFIQSFQYHWFGPFFMLYLLYLSTLPFGLVHFMAKRLKIIYKSW